jgi:ubiquitin C-terminal hydrolase
MGTNLSDWMLYLYVRKFTSAEPLDEYYCDKCSRSCPSTLSTAIHTLPDVLVLHLKRLVISPQGVGTKVRTLVKFPLVDLDMTAFTTGIYHLTIVVMTILLVSVLALHYV